MKLKSLMSLTTLLTLVVLASQANGQTPPATPQTVVLPQPYESIILSAGALATSAATALKTQRKEARTLAIRSILATKIRSLTAGATIDLDKASTNAALGEVAILCRVRQDYIRDVISLNYLNTLVQNLNAVSKPASPATDIVSAVKILLATSTYSISNGVQSKPLADLQRSAESLCEGDLKSYDKDYYGIVLAPELLTSTIAAPAAANAIPSLSFLGPYGALIDTFISIIQPIFIDAATVVDVERRRQVIESKLADPKVYAKIEATGKQLAEIVDNFATQSRRKLAGAFVEQLVAIREKPIDLSKEADCQGVAGKPHLPSGAPSAAFISCWKAAWAQLDPMVTNLVNMADSYDGLADAADTDAWKLFATILADYDLIRTNRADASAIFWDDVTQFITFANAVSSAESKSNLTTLKSEIAAASK